MFLESDHINIEPNIRQHDATRPNLAEPVLLPPNTLPTRHIHFNCLHELSGADTRVTSRVTDDVFCGPSTGSDSVTDSWQSDNMFTFIRLQTEYNRIQIE